MAHGPKAAISPMRVRSILGALCMVAITLVIGACGGGDCSRKPLKLRSR